jgi:hypothetical protein
MNEKKNIERLFQEKFKDFEVTPNGKVWENIEAKLNKKEKRRIIPFWWKLSGIAASLLIGFLITNALFFNTPKAANTNTIVIQENNNSTKNQTTKKPAENTAIVNSETKIGNGNSKQDNGSNENVKSATTTLKNNTQIAISADKKLANSIEKNRLRLNKQNRKSNANNPAIAQENQTVVADLEKKESIEQKELNSKNSSEKAIVATESTITKEGNNSNNTFENRLSKTTNSSNLVVAENKILEIKNSDTTKIAVVNNALEELLKEKESKKKAEPKLNRWQVATTVAPIYFSSTSGGSPLDSRFDSNDKEFEPSYSYGLGVNYALNKKWSLRTGVNALAFEYNTNDVVFYQNVNAHEIQHVKKNLQGSVLQIENKNNTAVPEMGMNSEIVKKFDGRLNQRMGYIEIPVEIGYKLIDKKFGMEIITGISSLILNENSVSVTSSGQSITIGEANNLNDFHFSGNLGLGFRYRFWKSFNANVNPMFKYQMNTFNTDSGNFKPYVFGLYSGISYTF